MNRKCRTRRSISILSGILGPPPQPRNGAGGRESITTICTKMAATSFPAMATRNTRRTSRPPVSTLGLWMLPERLSIRAHRGAFAGALLLPISVCRAPIYEIQARPLSVIAIGLIFGSMACNKKADQRTPPSRFSNHFSRRNRPCNNPSPAPPRVSSRELCRSHPRSDPGRHHPSVDGSAETGGGGRAQTNQPGHCHQSQARHQGNVRHAQNFFKPCAATPALGLGLIQLDRNSAQWVCATHRLRR